MVVLWAGSIQSLEFLKKSWNLPRNFQTWKNFLRFLKVCIDHLFGNLESREWNYCYGKKCEKSLEFWIQKSLRTLCELNPSPHSVIYPICNAPLWEIGAAQLRSVAEIAPKSPFLCVNRIAIRYGFCAGAKLSGLLWTPIRYVTLHFRDRRGAAPLRYRNRAKITVLTCEQKLYPVWFLCQRKSYPV